MAIRNCKVSVANCVAAKLKPARQPFMVHPAKKYSSKFLEAFNRLWKPFRKL
jgi:hypothetical protein